MCMCICIYIISIYQEIHRQVDTHIRTYLCISLYILFLQYKCAKSSVVFGEPKSEKLRSVPLENILSPRVG